MNISKTLGAFGTLSIANFGRKHAEKCAAHKDMEIQARGVAVMQNVTDLEQAYAARRPLAALWTQATDAKDAADDALDDAVRALSYDLLGPSALKGDRSSPLYKALFPAGNIAFIDGPDRAEIAQVQGMAAHLEANPQHPMAGRAADLRSKCAALEAALGPLASAEAAFRAAQGLERDKRDALCRSLRKSVTFLRDRLDADEKKVEALFPTIAESKVAGDEQPAA
ncbi:MAG: hypothetical protein PHU25_04655 [Deltaproteobacteria bacterium]|nr:hypothetical protein [Deltaproteobacteria bacterium]